VLKDKNEVIGPVEKPKNHQRNESQPRRHDSAFKARVALEATKGEKTIHEIAKIHDIHPTQITEWKKRSSTK
jgi:transposase-like protein